MADGSLAAAAGTYQSKGAACGDIQIHPVDHFPVGVIAVVDIFEGDVTLQPGRLSSMLGIHFRLGVHHFQEALKAADAALQLLREANQGGDGVQEQVYGHDEGGVVRKINLAAVEEQAAGNEDYYIEHFRDEGGGGVELGHGLVLIPAGFHIHAVAALEFFLFLGGVGKGLGDPDTGNGALQGGVDLGNGLAALPEGCGHFIPDADCHKQQHRHTQEDNQRQPDVDTGKIHESYNDGNGADDQIFRAVVSQLADFLQVTGEAAHDLAGFMLIVVGEGELLQMVEQVAAHVRLHPHAHDVALILDEIVQPHPHQVDQQHADASNDDHLVVPVGDQIVEHGAGDHGIDNGREGYQQGGQHIQGKELGVGLIVF